jgi:hypothetical protein
LKNGGTSANPEYCRKRGGPALWQTPFLGNIFRRYFYDVPKRLRALIEHAQMTIGYLSQIRQKLPKNGV